MVRVQFKTIEQAKMNFNALLKFVTQLPLKEDDK